MFRAAFQSAFAENPQCLQRNSAWLLRLAFSQCPQSEHVRLVLRGSTCTMGIPASCALYDEEADELVERPTRQPVASVSAPSRYPFANALEVFNGDAASGAFGGLDDRFADAVVLVPAEPGFLAGDRRSFFFAPLVPLLLESLPLEVVLAADPLDGLAAVLRRRRSWWRSWRCRDRRR